MSENVQETLARLNEQVADWYHQGRYQQALPQAHAAYDLSRHHLDEADPASVTALFQLATLHFTLGHYAQAEPLFQQVLALQRQISGPQHPDVLTTMNNLASLSFTTGAYEQAQTLYQQVLASRLALTGEQHPDVATSQSNLASLYYTMGNYEQAKLLYQQALATWRLAGEEDHPHVAVILNNLGALLSSEGDYEQAATSYYQALVIQRRVLGEEHPAVAATLNNLAELAATLGAYSEAEVLYEQALAIQQTTRGLLHPETAKTLGNLAVLYATTGAYQQAEQLYLQVLDSKRTLLGELHPDVASSLHDLAALYQDLGDYRQAESSGRRSLQIRRQVLGENHPETAVSLRQLGITLAARGDFAQAQALYQQALQIQQAVLGEEHPEVASSLNNLAVLHQDQGDYASALALLQQALSIQRQALGEEHPEVAVCLNNIASLYGEMGDYPQAAVLLQRALTIEQAALGEDHPQVAISLNNLAHVRMGQERYPEAEELFQLALAIQRKALGEEHPVVAICVQNLAMLAYATEDYARAVELARQALRIQRLTLDEEHPEIAISLSNLAVLAFVLGEHEQAMIFARQALALQRALLGELHPDVAGSLQNLAVCCVATGRTAEALTLMQEAAGIDDHMVDTIFAMGSERQRLAYLAVLRGDLDAFLSLVLQHFSSSPEAVQAAANLVLRRKAITVEALALQQEAMLRGRYRELTPAFEALTTLRRQIAQKELAGPEPGEGQSYRQQLQTWNEQKEQLEADLARRLPELRASQRRQSVSFQAIARSLPAGSALLEFVHIEVFDAAASSAADLWQPARYLAFLLLATAPEEVHLFDLGEAGQIDRQLAALRLIITTATCAAPVQVHPHSGVTADNESATACGVALRRLLFDPMREALRDCRRLFLAPDGELSRLPFEILPTDEGGHLLDIYQISYLGSGRDLLRAPATSPSQASAPLVIADPDFDLRSPDAGHSEKRQRDRQGHSPFSFTRLAGTRQEGEQVARMLGVRPLLAEQALEAGIKACHSPRLLHIATHGFFLPDRPRQKEPVLPGGPGRGNRLAGLLHRRIENPLLRCGLALAGVNTWSRGWRLPVEAEDGLLTGEDVSGLDLCDTELVVLSACETGLGEIQRGEGVFGLRRAFVLAGARTLVMSRWKIPDQQTQELMEAFYHALAAGLPCADALRAGQLLLKTRYMHPYYWGAFICQGGQ
jgi:tetratricopeptide (TPR) repeat protein/CHAT domain-containing protein